MWVGIVTMTFLIIYRYLYKFYRLLKSNEQFRITALARYAAAMGRGEVGGGESIYDIVYRLKRKVRVLLAMAVITMVCWYPLYILTLLDIKYVRQKYIYRILTVIAWSHSALVPLPLLLIDKYFGICYQVKRLMTTVSIAAGSPEPKRHLLQNNQSVDKSTPPPYPRLHLVTSYKRENGHHRSTTELVRQPNVNVRSYGGVSGSTPSILPSHNESLGFGLGDDRVRQKGHCGNNDFMFNANSLESRVNQSRETDLLYDNSSLPDYDML